MVTYFVLMRLCDDLDVKSSIPAIIWSINWNKTKVPIMSHNITNNPCHEETNNVVS